MFKKAQRKKSKLRLGISGTSGSGKTWSSLLIASGMGGKIALIDTENGRAELYGDDFNYDCIQITSPYTVERYVEAIKTAEKEKYDILIIDSLSHAWAGEGGILSLVERSGGNSFTNGWKAATPKQNMLIETIIQSPLHIITTFRSKSEWGLQENEKGKLVPKKIGLAPIQRADIEYEYTIFMNIDQDNVANITKDNTKLYNQQYIKPTREFGENLIKWLNEGKSLEDINEENKIIILNKLNSCNNLEELKIAFKYLIESFSSMNNFIIEEKDKMKEKLNG